MTANLLEENRSVFLWKSKGHLKTHEKPKRKLCIIIPISKLYDKQDTGKKHLWMFTQHPSKIYNEKSSEIYKEIYQI